MTRSKELIAPVIDILVEFYLNYDIGQFPDDACAGRLAMHGLAKLFDCDTKGMYVKIYTRIMMFAWRIIVCLFL